MTFQQLQYILEIGNTGSISGAAKKLFVSPSSVSVCLNILEKELGYPLFDRAPNCFKPTPEGRLVLDYAQQICSTHQLLNNVGRDEVRTVRINCTDQPPIAKAFTRLLCENRHRTDLRIENIHCQHNEIYPMLATRQLDVSLSSAISYAAGNWIKTVQQSGLHLHVLKTVPAVIHVGPGHRLYNAEKINPHDLRNDHYIDDPHAPLQGDNAFSSNLYVDPQKILHIGSPAVRKEAMMLGMGFVVGVMPPKNTASVFRSIPLDGCFFYFNATTNSQAPAKPEVTRFLELAKQNLDKAYPEY